jgi:two-component system, OmpR family, response regulator
MYIKRHWNWICPEVNERLCSSMADLKVLVVDDDSESRGLISEVLESNGYSVASVADGAAAREILAKDASYRVVIADLRMPKENGLDLIRSLRQNKTRHEFILMSSFISAAEKKLAETLGVRALLDKPFRLSDLLQSVSELAEKKPIGITP